VNHYLTMVNAFDRQKTWLEASTFQIIVQFGEVHWEWRT